MNKEKEQLLSLIQIIQSQLCNYLQQVQLQYSVFDDTTSLNAFVKSQYTWQWIKKDDTPYIVVFGDIGGRIHKLLAERIANILSVQKKITAFEKTISDFIDPKEAHRALSTMKDMLLMALHNNNTLSAQFNKTHISYYQNKSAGYNRFFSWWHKTWFQSRATVAIENAIESIDRFKHSFPAEQKPSF